MDRTALALELAARTVAILLRVSVPAGRWLAHGRIRGKGAVAALVMLPLVLPPTVFGFYLLVAFGRNSAVGAFWQETFGHQLVFTFEGPVVASVIFNPPFAIQPAQRGFEANAVELREAAATCGLSPPCGLWSVEPPLAWPGLMTAMLPALPIPRANSASC